MWKCLLCNTRATTNLVKHSNTEHHKAAVREIERRNNLHEQTSKSLKAELTKNLQMETYDSDGEDLISTDVNYFSIPNESDAESINSSELSSEYLDSLPEISEEMKSSTDTMFETNIDDEVLGDSEDWYPFTKKEELGNPLVSSYLEFYPEQSAGKNIYKLSQSKKWLQEYPRDLRAQMISVGGKHYYIYEPVQINDGSVVVPMFFYIKGGKMYAKACKLNFSVISSAEVNIFISWNRDFYSDDIKEIVGEDFLRPYAEILVSDRILLASKCRNILHEYTPEGKEIIQLSNPWRIKAEGKMIRHVPLSFYADDTSGNISKQWNKHISIFMSLAGLPPKLSNTEFNKLFVATSNIASALELAAPVFEELKKLTTTGFTAFDYSLQVDVLVLPVVLLFMADSPMHAEITSTMQPNASLMPCRICNLKAENKKEKATATYVDRFLGCKTTGYIIVQPDLRCWTATKNNAYHTWKLVQQRASKKKNSVEYYRSRGKRYVKPGSFDGHKDMPVEVLHVVLLGILKYLYQDLIGGLSANLTKYMADLDYFAQDFLLKLISTNAQWVNKPKFHMLIHLSQSIAHFGPTSLFATEKYESYNGVVRQASIHSNRQSHSHDIATSFQNYAALIFFFSGGITQAEPSRSNIIQNSQIKKLLLNNSNIQKLFGFDPQFFKPQPRYPFFNQPPQSSAVYDESVPFGIKTKSPNSNWIKITSFYLDKKQINKGNSFIIVKAQPTNKNFIAYIIGIWGVDDFFNQKIYIHCIPCEILEMDLFYGIHTLKKLNKEEFLSAKREISGVNAQHHCEGAKCLIIRTLPMRLERQETDIILKEIHHHFNFNLYVINTASLRSQEYHHASARIPTPQIQPLDALNAVHVGLSKWKKSKNSKGKNKAPESITSIDPSLT
ncbi:hypothetical protein BY996DRAFT_8420195 [Phakopsora pachyrhizi]|nr:hypothetical protein BY996DRAFT_8420195 [Phakopsora pachyrhizi]